MLPRLRLCARRVTKGNTDAPCTADAGDGLGLGLRPHASGPPPNLLLRLASTAPHRFRPQWRADRNQRRPPRLSDRKQPPPASPITAPGSARTIVVDPCARFLYHVPGQWRGCVSASPSVRPARTFAAMPRSGASRHGPADADRQHGPHPARALRPVEGVCAAASTTRWGRGRCICIRAAATPCIAFTAPWTRPHRSARRPRLAVSACSTRTSWTCSTRSRTAPRSRSARRLKAARLRAR